MSTDAALEALAAAPPAVDSAPAVATERASVAVDATGTTVVRVGLEILDALTEATTSRFKAAEVARTTVGRVVDGPDALAMAALVDGRRTAFTAEDAIGRTWLAQSDDAELGIAAGMPTRPTVVMVGLEVAGAVATAAGLPPATPVVARAAVVGVGAEVLAFAAAVSEAGLALADSSLALRVLAARVVPIAAPPHLLAGSGRVAMAPCQE